MSIFTLIPIVEDVLTSFVMNEPALEADVRNILDKFDKVRTKAVPAIEADIADILSKIGAVRAKIAADESST